MIVPYSFPLVMGNEFVGIIEKKGSAVKGFVEGDRVYGRLPLKKIGAFAEYAAVDSLAIAKVPEYLSDEEAACVQLTALQTFELMHPRAGESVFISGGTGSLGAMSIPVAKSFGLTVITNGNGSSAERVRKLGADKFIDYKKEDYSKVLSDVDYVLDTLGDRELMREFAILKKGGIRWVERKDNIENIATISLTYMQNFNYVQKSGKSRGCCKWWNTCNDA